MAYIDKITAINSSNNTSEVFDIKDTTSGYTTNTGTVTKVTVGSDLKVGSTAGGNITTTGTITHANSVTAKTTQALYPIKYDAQGHITGSGSAVTNISAFTNDVGYVTSEDIPEGASAYTGTISAVGTAASSGTSNGFARGDHTHNITKTTIDSTLGTGSGTTKFYREDGSWATPDYIANTDEKLKIAAVTSGTTYYPVVAANSTTAATRQYDATGLAYAGTNGTTSAVGTAKITLGNSTASGTANNKKGQITLYGSTAYATTIDPGSPTAARTITLPDKAGTVALTSDIPTISYPVTSVNTKTGAVSLTASDVGAAASSHAHGNITSGGDITATAPTIASGDQIIINDNSASKITNGPTFDGSTTTKALTQKGTWETFSKFSGSYDDLSNKPTIPTVPTNISAFTNDSGYITSYTDTKNTAGSTNTSSKIYLIGATSQAANPQTYSNSKLYYTRSSGLYSEGGNDDNFSVISQSSRKIDLYVSTDNTSHTPKVTVDETGVYVGDTTVSSSTITLNSGLWWSDSDNYVRIKNLIAPTNNLDAANKKYVDDSIPTNVSQLTNDSGYITSADVPEGASAYTGTISAVGTAASSGTNNGFARGDHVHNITSSTITSALGYTPGTSNLAIGTTATTAAAGNHTHTTSLTTSTGTSTVSLSANSKYQITAGGTSVIFTTPSDSDTKNTAGSTNTSSKIFLIGATSQAANPQTYSHDTAYVGTDGKLYSASKAVLVGGSNASSSVTITPTTTDVYSMTSAGSVTAGTKASFTRGTFSQGTLPTMTWAMDSTDTKKLNITFSQGTLPTHAADSFTANTPTAVTLPGRSSAIKAWTGYSAATADAQTFTGVTA